MAASAAAVQEVAQLLFTEQLAQRSFDRTVFGSAEEFCVGKLSKCARKQYGTGGTAHCSVN
jgi:hypothetical protein